MKTNMFDYNLPSELIAQEPIEPRDASRLLVLDRKSGRVEHRMFCELPELLGRGDLAVFNTTKVMPARIFGRKSTGGFIEALILTIEPDGTCRALLRHGRKVKINEILEFADGALKMRLLERHGEEFHLEVLGGAILPEILEKHGKVPLPPYIEREAAERDRTRYQTVYADSPGAIAAPTAGLHFTEALLNVLKEKGIERCDITLHVGYGTFKPVKTEEIEKHKMHSERFLVSADSLKKIQTRQNPLGRIVAIGTTSCRFLETLARDGTAPYRQSDGALSGATEIFIYPGFEFKLTGALITNFHLPKSTLLMLVSAFAGREKILAAYEEAVREKYRFFSYGDAMLIV